VLKFEWSRGLAALLLFILLFLSPCNAQDDLLSSVTLTRYPKGSYSVRYGGFQGFVRNQITSQLHSLHRDWLDIINQHDPIAGREKMYQMAQSQRDINNGGAWFNRRWWESFPEEKGGAPAIRIRAFRGPTKNIIDIGVAYVTPDFSFKWREYRVNLTRTFSPSSQIFPSPHEWNFRFRPSVRFSTRDLIRRISVAFVFEYSYRGDGLIEIGIYSLYSIRFMEGQTGIFVGLLKW